MQYVKEVTKARSVLAAVLIFGISVFIHSAKIDGGVESFAKFLVHALLHTCLVYALIWVVRNSLPGRLLVALIIGIELFARVSYSSSTSIVVLMSILSVTPGEASSFFRLNALHTLLVVILVSGLFILPPLKGARVRIVALIGLCYLILPTLIDYTKISDRWNEHFLTSSIARGQSEFVGKVDMLLRDISYRFPSANLATALLDTANAFRLDASSESTWSGVTQDVSDGTELLVLGIGESLRADNLSIYGYARETTPLLAGREEELEIYSHAFSPAANTWVALPAILTRFEGGPTFSKSIVNLAKDAGYETHWISNQGKYLDFDISVSTIADQADHAYFESNSESGTAFDGALLERFEQILENRQPGSRTLVILHFYGSHAVFKDRYPEDFDVFNDGDSLIDEYDNSVLYTDYVQSTLIDIVEKANGKYIFFADHGLTYPELKHDSRDAVDIESLRVPFFATSGSGMELGQKTPISLLYFECFFSKWSGISATALEENRYCESSLERDTIDYMDVRMNPQQHQWN